MTEVFFSYSSAIWNLPFDTEEEAPDTSKEN